MEIFNFKNKSYKLVHSDSKTPCKECVFNGKLCEEFIDTELLMACHSEFHNSFLVVKENENNLS